MKNKVVDKMVCVVTTDIGHGKEIAMFLIVKGYRTEVFSVVNDALLEIKRYRPVIVISDLYLPGTDGVSLCSMIRRFSIVPIIMMSSGNERDILGCIISLEIGADDYILKPFSLFELLLRIENILARVMNARRNKIPREGNFEIDTVNCRVMLCGSCLELTTVEFKMLCSFVTHLGKVMTREELSQAENINGVKYSVRGVDSHIKNLRIKIDLCVPGVSFIHTVYGKGYFWEGRYKPSFIVD